MLAYVGGCSDGTPKSESPSPTASPTVRSSPTPADVNTEALVVIEPPRLFILDSETGSEIVEYTHDAPGWITETIWSPDGSRLAFVISGGSYLHQIFVADTEGNVSQVGELPSGSWSVSGILWSPDGESIVLLVDAGILRISLSGEPPVEVYTEPDSSTFLYPLLGWMSDGERVVVRRESTLITVNVITGDVAEVYEFEASSQQLVSVSQDRSRAAIAVPLTDGGCSGWATRYSIMVVDLESGADNELVPHVCELSSLAWSPEGDRLTYSVVDVCTVQIFPPCSPSGEGGVYVLDVDSGDSTRVSIPPRDLVDIDVTWVDDGSGIVVTRNFCWGCDGFALSWAWVSATGGDEQMLPEWPGRFWGFAPDSQRYLLVDDALQTATLGSAPTPLTEPDPASSYELLTWSPTGEWISYIQAPNQQPREYAVSVETGEVTQLWAPPKARGFHQSSPDGRSLAWVESEWPPAGAQSTELWLSKSDGSESRMVVSRDGGIASFDWSPDGGDIVYLAGDPTSIFMVETETGRIETVATLAQRYTGVQWSPSGERLALIGPNASLAFFADLVILELATGVSQRVGKDITHLGMNWSPDGKGVAYTTEPVSGQLHAVFVDLNTEETTSLGEGTAFPSWSPSGAEIAFWRQLAASPDEPQFGLYIRSAETGEEREIARFEAIGGAVSGGEEIIWAPDGGRVAVIHWSVDLVAGVYVVQTDGSGVTRVTAMTGRSYELMGWSRDGQEILFDSLYQGL